MKQVQLKDVKPYNPPKHFDMVALKLQGKDETGISKFWQGLSYFLPNGGCEMQYEEGTFGAEFDKTYFVIEGEIVVTDAQGNEYICQAGDSIAMLPNEGRKAINRTNHVAKVLVTVSTS